MKKIAKKIITSILRREASAVLRKYKPKIVAVIGSVGKTSTKDAIYSVFSQEFFVRKSEKSFNSDIGIPLTVLGCGNGWNDPVIWLQNIFSGLRLLVQKQKYPEWLILEIGVDRPGDMKSAAGWIKPDILVVTRFADVPVHVENFSSPEALIAEKSLMITALKKDGVLVLNADDEKVLALKSKWNGKIKTYGFNEKADIRGSHLSIMYGEDDIERKFPTGTILRLNVGDTSVPARIFGTLGKTSGYGAMATAAASLSAGINLVKISEGLSLIVPPPGRMRLITGIKRSLILDDSYNASPVAMKSALETLKEVATYGRKFAVLGDMLELGKYSTDEHKKAGALAKDSCDVLVTVGVRARNIAEGALDNGMDENNIYQFESSREAGKYLEKLIGDGDIVLVKGSQGSGTNKIRMEQAVEEIMAEPEKAGELLVRQGEEWKVK
ncbi:MAG: Mur ligase family protein [Candidatus Paceibacterota bacterium]|jgi:UDP-N-acetylmuramoyl-tripeptide--D-alanyl-D-alanine ligase|nr:Mur ligase family protein [Candidatus Paceibacterota bacterium]